MAPSPETQRNAKSIFLAGTTSSVPGDDWRQTVIRQLEDVAITIYNPYRSDWNGSWVEDVSFAPFREQVVWELEKREKADLVVVFFHPESQATISLLELGLSVNSRDVLVCCPEGYWKRGNVQIVCERYGVKCVDTVEALCAEIQGSSAVASARYARRHN